MESTPKFGPGELVGRLINEKYLMEELVGSGAMGCIYKARDQQLGRTVAMKVLHSDLVSHHKSLQRFKREALAASRLRHPNCITVLDFGQTPDGVTFIAMEYLAGLDLFQVLRNERQLEIDRVVHFSKQILGALIDAHDQGIIHRDLKPENIMVEQISGQRDFVKVLDFGIAKIRDDYWSESSALKTDTGIVFGTPEYMSPEQIQGGELDGRSDLYGLGIIMYQMLTGKLPFAGEKIVEIATAHLRGVYEPLSTYRQGVPDQLIAFVNKLMRTKREERFASAQEALAKLNQLNLTEITIPIASADQLATQGSGGPRRYSDDSKDTIAGPSLDGRPEAIPSKKSSVVSWIVTILILGALIGGGAWVLKSLG